MPPRRSLTPNETKFVYEYVRTGNATDAYRSAYPKSANWRQDAVPTQAIRTLYRPQVRALVRQLRGEAMAAASITHARILLGLLSEAQLASARHQHGPAVRAWELLGKATGLFGNPELAPTTVNVAVSTAIQSLDAETLRALAARYDALDAPAVVPPLMLGDAVYMDGADAAPDASIDGEPQT